LSFSMSSLRLFICLFLVSTAISAWSFDEWAANELLPRTRDLVRRHMVGARMFLTEPKKEVEEGNINEKKQNSLENSNSSSSSSSSSSSEEKKAVVKKEEEVVAVTTQQPTTSSSSPSSSSPSTTTSSVSSVEKKTSEEEMAGKIVDVAEVLRKIAEKKDGKKDKSIAEVKLKKKLEKLPLVKETKVEGGVTVERVRKISSSPAPATGSTVPATTPIAEYRRVSCDMCLKAFNGLNYNVVQMKKVAEDMVSKDCEALLYGDEEAIGACVEVMLRKIEEYYNKFEPMIQTNKACVRLGMCAAHLVTNRVPQ
ncbi:hypothetical protein PENTCL1PPCAC_25643, partial [Pristionchus entomophagus]